MLTVGFDVNSWKRPVAVVHIAVGTSARQIMETIGSQVIGLLALTDRGARCYVDFPENEIGECKIQVHINVEDSHHSAARAIALKNAIEEETGEPTTIDWPQYKKLKGHFVAVA